MQLNEAYVIVVKCMRVNQAKQAVKCKLWHTNVMMLHSGDKLVTFEILYRE